MSSFTTLEQERQKFRPNLPKALESLQKIEWVEDAVDRVEGGDLQSLFPKTSSFPKLKTKITEGLAHSPLKIGVVLSGGQAAGGHNVIAAIFDTIKKLHSESALFGFLNGPQGILSNAFIKLTESFIFAYRNQGGFDMIGSGRTKIETKEQFERAAQTVLDLDLDGLVIIGGDDSNTNAALLAEYFLQHKIKTKVIGVPKTIDGDLKNEEIEISFGFDTATKTYSAIIGDLLRDCLSAKKYFFFVKLMGRSASHIALECALQTHPNLTLIGEEIAKEQKTFRQITEEIADLVCKRALADKNYGMVLIPEGTIEFIPEFKELISELNSEESAELSFSSKSCLKSLPKEIQSQLLMERDPHGNVQVSKIEIERLFIEAVKEELEKRRLEGRYQGKFSPQPYFCGYEGRSCLPSNFDSQYCYSLGCVSALLIDSGKTGYMSCIKRLFLPIEEWEIAGVSLTSMIHLEKRKGKLKPVIKKALVDLEEAPFLAFKEKRDSWLLDDDYCWPGPLQFFGPKEITDSVTLTLSYESEKVCQSK